MSAAKSTDVEKALEIIRLAGELDRIVDDRGLTVGDFEQMSEGYVREDAVAHVIWKIERLLEEAKELCNSQPDAFTSIDISGVSKMRDKTTHHYEDRSEELFWDFYETDLPVIVDACQRYLARF